MVNKLPVRKSRSSTGCEPERTIVDSGDEAATNEDTGGRATVEKVVLTERGEYLHYQETESESNTSAYVRDIVEIACTVCVVRLGGKVDQSLVYCECLHSAIVRV